MFRKIKKFTSIPIFFKFIIINTLIVQTSLIPYQTQEIFFTTDFPSRISIFSQNTNVYLKNPPYSQPNHSKKHISYTIKLSIKVIIFRSMYIFISHKHVPNRLYHFHSIY